jgi:hypothetical protein
MIYRALLVLSACLAASGATLAAGMDCPTLDNDKVESLLSDAPSCDASMACLWPARRSQEPRGVASPINSETRVSSHEVAALAVPTLVLAAPIAVLPGRTVAMAVRPRAKLGLDLVSRSMAGFSRRGNALLAADRR